MLCKKLGIDLNLSDQMELNSSTDAKPMVFASNNLPSSHPGDEQPPAYGTI
jgi:hypothetical protein